MKNIIMKWLNIPTDEEIKEKLRREKQIAIDEALAAYKKQQEQAEQERIENLSPKDRATEAKEPYVDIVKFELNPNDKNYGSFEIEWNKYFIDELKKNGYPGKTDEEIIDIWFADVCRNVALETLAQEEADPDKRDDINVRFINRKDLGDGKSEIS